MILLLCGTVEGRQVLHELLKRKIQVLATVTTSYGADLLKQEGQVTVLEERLDQEGMEALLKGHPIQAVVDVTHPYAQQISKLAMGVCAEKDIPYLRYERGQVTCGDQGLKMVKDFKEAAQEAKKYQGSIFLTIGSKEIPTFLEEINVERLIARVLPLSSMVKACEDYGFTPDNLIAMKGPFSEAMNQELFRQYCPSVIITKDSGMAGGTQEKIRAAQKLNIPIIVVQRPIMNYGQTHENTKELIQAVQKVMKFEEATT
ncbi:precorrin-6x reductase [Alkaliphilus metalliredigens QYMF]|uniref:Precorrin-6x reductase n=1 Tax=Alkaliphilus metalliredigens (strain QYMF) TaxID=293826 RepID=A6TJF2_ALKMQ|nr:cobalt-precorrin-6A reductase [Alkaliphilus metalliredigens]ABR46320.1 precorrin-6x reductase [Alkaliphilus metalliredigens QYMF]